MSHLSSLYRANLSMLTDLYQLTMAYGYWKAGRADDEAVFHLFFRTPPFGSGYTIAAGLDVALDLINDFHYEADDLDYLGTLTGADNTPLFEREFLNYLDQLKLSLDVDAMPEGTVVFGNEPLLRVRGPLLQCQLLETALLNIINFQTLVATKASRISLASTGGSLLEFGLRRAQGPDGAISATRAAYIGGVDATSNVLAGKLLGIPVKGTHAHSWVMSFDDEPAAFAAYADAMPGNALFLVDTYDTLEGVRHAIEVGHKLRERGQRLLGIRLDSGDLAYLSIEARKLLDAAGFTDAVIVASNDLDEHLIDSLREQGAKVAVWGVGTKLATSYDQPALGGVYKLGAIRAADGTWQHRIKVAEQQIKTSIPGMLQVRRFHYNGAVMADMIFDEIDGVPSSPTLVDPLDSTRRRKISDEIRFEDLLVRVVRAGRRSYASPTLDEIRAHRHKQISLFHPSIKRFVNPHQHPVGLESELAARRTRMILAARALDTTSETA